MLAEKIAGAIVGASRKDYACVKYLKWIGMGVLTIVTIGMVVWNRMRITAEERKPQE